MKHIILDGKNILKVGSYLQSQLDKYQSLGYTYELMPDDYPKNTNKKDIEKKNGKFVKKVEELSKS